MALYRRVPILILPVVFLLLALTASAEVSGPKIEKVDQYARDHLIVKFRSRARKSGLKALKKPLKGKVKRKFRSSGAVLVKLDPGVDVDAVIEAVRADPNVAYAARDHYLRIHAVPNDPDFESLWGLHNEGQMLGTPDADIDAPEAWDITTGSESMIVAVIDTGVDYTHDDLAGNMWVNEAEASGTTGVDDDGNGYVDDVHGISVINGEVTGDPLDDHGHGSHVAGIIGAVGNNNRGVVGVNWTVKIMALKFLSSSGYGLESDAATCVEYAIANGAKVLNNSYGGDYDSTELHAAIAAANTAGVLFVTSSGNETLHIDEIPSYPASYPDPNIISVLSTGGSDNISYFSNYGTVSVDVGAPGEAIWSTFAFGEYQLLDGTSMASPYVAGVAALVWSHFPGMSMADLRDRVMWTGDRSFDLEETTVTGLRVNAYNALTGIYSVRVMTPSPLPPGTVGTAYSKPMEAQGFAPPYTWSWGEPQYLERETANGFTGGGVEQDWEADEGMWELDLSAAFPGGFPFYGVNYDRVYVCSNGYVEFADSPPPPEWVSDIGLLASKKMIAVYWTDLTTGNEGSGGWKDVLVWQPTPDSLCIRWRGSEADWLLGLLIDMELVLHSDGRIEMHYGPFGAEDIYVSLVGGVVGISNGDGTNYRMSTKKTGDLFLRWAPTSLWIPGQTPPGLSMLPAGEITGTPTQAGLYEFDVTVEDDTGGSHTKQFAMKVFPATGPVADFTADPVSGDAPLTVQFTDASLSDHIDGITAWSWDFGDGETSTVQNPLHAYDSSIPATYTVSLTVTDADGTDAITKLRYIEAMQPGADVDFTAEPVMGPAPLTVNFTDLTDIREDDVLLRVWDFGDGGSSGIKNPSHTYTSPGTYDVTLMIIDWFAGIGVEAKYGYVTVFGDTGAMDVTPEDGFSSSGAGGGPFSPASKVYTLTNSTADPVSWSAGVPDHTGDPPQSWAPVTLDVTEGALQPGQTVDVTVSINQVLAASLPGGVFTETVTFRDITNATSFPRAVTLTVNRALDHIEITGPSAVDEHTQTDYTCMAHYDDGSSQEVEPTWSVAPTTYASLDAAGLLSAAGVPSDQAVTIEASYTEGLLRIDTHVVTISDLNTARFYVDPADNRVVYIGHEFDTRIMLDDVEQVKRIECTLTFSNSVLSVVGDPTQGDFISGYTLISMPTAAELNAAGTGTFVFELPGGGTPAAGTGPVAEVRFAFIADWADLPTPLTLSDTLLLDVNDQVMTYVAASAGVREGIHGDFDGNEDIDFWDLTNFIGVYGLTNGNPAFEPDGPFGDFDDDGDVDFWDLSDFIEIY